MKEYNVKDIMYFAKIGCKYMIEKTKEEKKNRPKEVPPDMYDNMIKHDQEMLPMLEKLYKHLVDSNSELYMSINDVSKPFSSGISLRSMVYDKSYCG